MSDSIAYDSGRAVLLGVDGRWDDDDAKFLVLLAKSTYQPDESHKTVEDVGKHELAGGGYQRQALGGRALRKNPDTHRVEFVAEPAVFTKLFTDQSYRWAVVFRQNQGGGTTLVCAVDMGGIALRGLSRHRVRWDGKTGPAPVLSVY